MTRVGLRRFVYRNGYHLMRLWWFVRRPTTYGVKLVLRDGDQLLFVRHSYGRRVWELPGGGLRRDEAPRDAARREAYEELGLEIEPWRPIGEIEARDHATARLSCLTADYDGRPLKLDLGELEEFRWAPRTTPPRPLGDHAAAILDLPGLVGRPLGARAEDRIADRGAERW